MTKSQKSYACGACGAVTVKWQGQCPSCGEWNSLEAARVDASTEKNRGWTSVTEAKKFEQIGQEAIRRRETGIGELDRALGGGLVPGSVTLIGGDPGIGKSTLLLQTCADHLDAGTILYVSGEESMEQIALRANRLGIEASNALVVSAVNVDEIVAIAEKEKPACVIIDSVQTIYTEQLPSAPGSVNQLKASTARLVGMAKSTGIAVILVGHVTKDGQIAGPRVLEHMVDTVLYFENEAGSRYRVLRTVKNRFGAANELGIFIMTETGMREVKNPSAIFLSSRDEPLAGSAVTVIHQGSRPLLVEVQALTDRSGGGPPRRVAIGLDQNRLALLLAALHRHGGIRAHDDDVFLNVVGGVKITETSADLPAMVATVSSMTGLALPRGLVVFGEVGLAGEIRPVPFGEERLREAAKLGFSHAVAPRANLPRSPIEGFSPIGVDSLQQALDEVRELSEA